MLRVFFPLLFCFFGSGFADTPWKMHSGHIEFDGEDLILSKHVALDAEMGKIHAEKVIFHKTSDMTHPKLDQITLEDHVQLFLTSGAHLKCQSAAFHFSTLRGYLDGGSDYVVFRDHIGGPISLFSKHMSLVLGGDKSVQEISAQKNVRFDYHQDVTLIADQATLTRTELLVKKQGASGVCQLMNPFGDCISAEDIHWDFTKRKLLLHTPKGQIALERKGNHSELLEIAAGSLVWDHADKSIRFKDDIDAELENFGHFTVDDEMVLTYSILHKKKRLQLAVCNGETHLQVQDPIRHLGCTFDCYGQMKIDRAKSVISMTSDGKKQICLQDGLARISADFVHVFFEGNEMKKALLEGHVQVVSRITETATDPMQYALADCVEYLPKTKELHLAAIGNGRVLFNDRLNHIQMSAPALKMKRSTPVQKGYIQGLGDVRFCFGKHENELMQETFHT